MPSYFPYVTGPANQARAISHGLAAHGFESRILTTNLGADSAPNREVLDGVEVRRLPIQAGFMQYHVALDALDECRLQPADLVHVHSYRNFLADTASLAARLRHLPLIVQLHGCLTGYRRIVAGPRRRFYGAYDALTRALPTLRADRIVVSSAEEAREAEQYGVDRGRLRVLPMGIDVDLYDRPAVPRDPTAITFVGRLAEDRNVEQLLRALALLADLPWSATIVGGEERRSYASAPGYVDRLTRLASELGLAHRLAFTGPLYGDQLRRAYAGAAIFAYPSRFENFGQTILEAAAAGCALVTTPVGVAHDLVRDGETGFLVAHDAPQALAAQLRWLLEHPTERAAMGERARALARREYAWPPILRRYADLYEEVLSERGRGIGPRAQGPGGSRAYEKSAVPESAGILPARPGRAGWTPALPGQYDGLLTPDPWAPTPDSLAVGET